MLDGFLCGVLLQPQRVPNVRWLAHVTDIEGRPLPEPVDPSRLHALVLRRHAELGDAIARRQWFDPWVFELEDEAGAGAEAQAGAGAEADVDARADAADADADRSADDDIAADADADADAESAAATEAVFPWVAGFAAAAERFPGLMAIDERRLNAPLALLYRHLDADDLEDADALLAEIESLEPPADLADAVEGLVRATLLLADVSRPLAAPSPPGAARKPAARTGPGRSRRSRSGRR